MPDLYELTRRPELDSPVLLVALDGWIDAGLGAATAMTLILQAIDQDAIAQFDTDALLDHRARRPTMHLVDGVNTGLTWPSIDLRVATDQRGNEFLLLVGAEPDHSWRAFSRAVVDLALDLDVRLIVSLGAYPAPTPHTRPTRVVATATTDDLARLVGSIPGRIDVPAGIHAAIERQAAEAGLPAVGLWAQVPHYAAAMPFPAAGVSLIETLARVADLHFDPAPLREDAVKTRARINELVSNSSEHEAMVHALEEQSDAAEETAGMNLVSGDELAAELERFLRDQGEPG